MNNNPPPAYNPNPPPAYYPNPPPAYYPPNVHLKKARTNSPPTL